jgi:hypothetical protein
MDVRDTKSTEPTGSPACCQSAVLEMCCVAERKLECCGPKVSESCQCDPRKSARGTIAT